MATNVQFDREKMRAVILRTCLTCASSDLGAVKLHKVLYYVDMISYAHHRRPVTGAMYRKRPNGPTAEQLLFVLRDMERAGDIEIRQVDYHGYWKKEYIARVSEPEHTLNAEERSLLDDVVDFVCRKNTAKSISDFSHSFPWEMAEMGGEIPYRSAMMLFPMEVTPEAMEQAEEGLPEIAASRSSKNTMDLPLLRDFRSRVLSELGQGSC